MAKDSAKPFKSIFRQVPRWQDLWFYQKSEVLYQMTYVFCERFLPQYGDRTVDQMVQAARSGKQNIVECSADGMSSKEMELKMINVARASLQELREDYEDYLDTRHLRWTRQHPRFAAMMEFTRKNNDVSAYEEIIAKGNDEEMANLGLTLTRQVDRMMMGYLRTLEEKFIEEGGLKEGMTAARLGRRQSQNEEIKALKARVAELEGKLRKWQEWYRENYRKPSDTLGNPRQT
jgi:four helix bundle suffix protein